MLLTRSFDEIQRRAEVQLAENTSIRNFAPGSTAKTILELVNSSVADAYASVNQAAEMAYLSTATGFFLDYLGDLLGTPRIENTFAVTTRFEENVKFYVNSGTLNSVTGLSSIASGTRVSSVATGSDSPVVFIVEEDAAFEATATEVYVSVISENSSQTSNVGKGAIQTHVLGFSGLYVINDYPILSGQSREEDTSYRYRLRNALRVLQQANRSAVEIAALSAPGIASATVRSYTRGIGTFDVYVEPIGGGLASPSLIIGVQDRIDEVQAIGCHGVVRQPDIIDTEFFIQLSFLNEISPESQEAVKRGAETDINDYIVQLGMGTPMRLSEIIRLVMNSYREVTNVEFKTISLNEKRAFVRDYTPRWNERLYPSRQVQEPIQVV